MKIKMNIWIGVIAVMAFFCVLGTPVTADEGEFTVLSTTPANGSRDIPSTTSVSISFSASANESTIAPANFIVLNTHDGDFFDGEISYDNATYTVMISNFSFRGGGQLEGGGGLHRGANIVVKLLNVKDIYGNKLIGSDGIAGSNYEFHFDVEPREKDAGEDSPGFGLFVVIIGFFAVMAVSRRVRKVYKK